MNRTIQQTNLIFIAIAMILAAALSRLLPHPFNFTPIGGMALFAGSVFQRYRFSWLLPFVALWASDLFLNNTIYSQYNQGFTWFSQPGVLIAFACIFLIGRWGIREWKPVKMIALSMFGSVLFFLVTNFASWASVTSLYPKDFTGLLSCYAAGIPFLEEQ